MSTGADVGEARPVRAVLGDRVEAQGLVCRAQVAWLYDGHRLSFASASSGAPMHTVSLAPYTLVAVVDTDGDQPRQRRHMKLLQHRQQEVLLVLKSTMDASVVFCLHSLTAQQFSRGAAVHQPLVEVCWLPHAPAAFPDSRASVAAASRSGEVALIDISDALDLEWGWEPDQSPVSVSTLRSKTICNLKEEPAHLSYSTQLHTLLALGATKGAFISLAQDKRVLEFQQERRRGTIVSAVAYAIVSDGTRYIMISTLHGNQPGLELYHVGDGTVAFDEDFAPLANLQLSGGDDAIITLPALAVSAPPLHKGPASSSRMDLNTDTKSGDDDDDDDDDDDGATTVFCAIAITTPHSTDIAVFVVDEDARLSSAWDDSMTWCFRHEMHIDLPAQPTTAPALALDLASVYRYQQKFRAEQQERLDPNQDTGIQWHRNVSLNTTLLASDLLFDIRCYGAQEAVLQRLSTHAVPMLCDPESTYQELVDAGLVRGAAESIKDKRDAVLEVLMYNGLTGAVGAYTRYLILQANLPMSARTLHPHDTLSSLWKWLLSFWQRYMRTCKQRFVQYLQGTPFSDNDLQPVLVMLSTIVKTLSGTAGSDVTLETVRQQEALIKDCIKLFKVIAWCEQNNFNESGGDASFLYELAKNQPFGLAAQPDASIALDSDNFASVRAFLKSKLPMNDVALACVYRMVVSAADAPRAASFADALELPHHITALVHGIAAMDRGSYEEGVALLSTADAPIFEHQHVHIVQHLCSQGHTALALKHWQAHEQHMLGAIGGGNDPAAVIDLLVSGGQLPLCFTRLRQARQQGHDTADAMDRLFQRCLEDHTVKPLLDLPFDEEESAMFQSFLTADISSAQRQEALLLFLLLKSRICDAFHVHHALDERTDVPKERVAFRAALMDNYKKILPQHLSRLIDSSGFRVPFEEFVASLEQQQQQQSRENALPTEPPAPGVGSPAMSRLLNMPSKQQPAHPAVHRVQPSKMQFFTRPPATPLQARPKSRSRLVPPEPTPRRVSLHETSFAALASPPSYASPAFPQHFVGQSDAGIMDESMQDVSAVAGIEEEGEKAAAAAAAEGERTGESPHRMDVSADEEQEQGTRKDGARELTSEGEEEEEEEDDDDDDDVTINLPKVMGTPSTSASTSMMSDRANVSASSAGTAQGTPEAAGVGGRTDLATPQALPQRKVTDNMALFSPQTPSTPDSGAAGAAGAGDQEMEQPSPQHKEGREHKGRELEEQQSEEEKEEEKAEEGTEEAEEEEAEEKEEAGGASASVSGPSSPVAGGVTPAMQRVTGATPRKAPSSPLARSTFTARTPSQQEHGLQEQALEREQEKEKSELLPGAGDEAQAHHTTPRHHLLHSLRSSSTPSGRPTSKLATSVTAAPTTAAMAPAATGASAQTTLASPASPMVRLSRVQGSSVGRGARVSTPRSASRLPSIALPRRKRESPPQQQQQQQRAKGGVSPASATAGLPTGVAASTPLKKPQQQRPSTTPQQQQEGVAQAMGVLEAPSPPPFSPDVSMGLDISHSTSVAASTPGTPRRSGESLSWASEQQHLEAKEKEEKRGAGMAPDAGESGAHGSRRVHITPARAGRPGRSTPSTSTAATPASMTATASAATHATPDTTFSPPVTRLSARKRTTDIRGQGRQGEEGLSTDSPVALPQHGTSARRGSETATTTTGRDTSRRMRAKRKKGAGGGSAGGAAGKGSGVSHGMTLRSGKHTTPTASRKKR